MQFYNNCFYISNLPFQITLSDTEHTFRQYYNIPNWVQTPGVFLFVYLIDLFLLALCFALFCFLGGGGGVSQ